MARVLIAYVPVVHAGYLALLDRHKDTKTAYVLGAEILSEFKELRKDIRALAPSQALHALIGLHAHDRLAVADLRTLAALSAERPEIVVPNDEVCERVWRTYLPHCDRIQDTQFLRWDSKTSQRENDIRAEETVTEEELHVRMMHEAYAESEKSGDFWRHVGSLIVTEDGKHMLAHNRHVPDFMSPYLHGDPRGNFTKGVRLELSTALHSEAALVARAAYEGISLRGAALYCTTFPCPPCARVVAYSGISTLYFSEGYSVLDGADLLREQGVDMVRVNMKRPQSR